METSLQGEILDVSEIRLLRPLLNGAMKVLIMNEQMNGRKRHALWKERNQNFLQRSQSCMKLNAIARNSFFPERMNARLNVEG